MAQENNWWVSRYAGAEATDAYILSHKLDMDRARTCQEQMLYLHQISEATGKPISQDTVILDGYAGTGRHGVELVQMGFTNVLSYDYSHAMLARGRRDASSNNLEVPLMASMDARTIGVADNSVQIYQAQNTSFIGFFSNPEDNMRVIQEAFRVIENGGVLAFDLVDIDYALDELREVHTESIDGDTLIVTDRATATIESGETFTVFTERHFKVGDSPDVDAPHHEDTIKIRVYSESEIISMLEAAGFTNCNYVKGALESVDEQGNHLGTRGIRNLYIAQKL